MQPRRWPSGNVFRVTKAPAFSLNRSGTLTVGNGRAWTYASTARRAICTASRPSSSEYAIASTNRGASLNVPGRESRVRLDAGRGRRRETYLSRGAPFDVGDGMRARVPVMEIMSRTPVTVSPDDTVDRAAATMRTRDIGSLIVVEGGKPSGIVTERDIVTKVAAPNLRPNTVRVRDIMSAPVVSIQSSEEVAEAARVMSERKIRRLAVVDDGKLVGVIAENDIIRIWPHLIEVTREYARLGLDEELRGIEGHCEACGMFSTALVLDKKLLVCPDCRGG